MTFQVPLLYSNHGLLDDFTISGAPSNLQIKSLGDLSTLASPEPLSSPPGTGLGRSMQYGHLAAQTFLTCRV